MPRFVAVDLTGLNPPNVIEPLDFETILAEQKEDIIARLEDLGITYDVHMLESDPAVKILEVLAYREVLLRARVNTAARAVMLAYAQKDDLDQLAVYYGVERQVVIPAQNNQPAVLETDERLRERVQLAPEALSIAGPEGAYRFHAMTSDPNIKDVGVRTPYPGAVDVIPLVNDGDGTPSSEILDTVRLALRKEDIRPLTDMVNVRPPEIVNYAIDVHLHIAEGPDQAVVEAEALAALKEYAFQRHRVGLKVAISGIYRAAHVSGVEKVTLNSPTSDIDPGEAGAAFCTGITITSTQEDSLLSV
jgi:phage-related baseplate assembly protein